MKPEGPERNKTVDEHLSDSRAEQLYRRGNRFYENKRWSDAENAWKQSYLEMRQPDKSSGCVRKQPGKRPHWRTVSAVFLVILSLYTCIFVLFPRQEDPAAQLMFVGNQRERSFWEEWWDTGRPSMRFSGPRLLAEDLFPMLRESMRRLMRGDRQDAGGSAHNELRKWLKNTRGVPGKQGPVDFYALTGRGLFNSRKYQEAIDTYKEGLHYAENPEQLGEMYQELGTAYYYQGYHLQPDGLAKYELPLVRKSIDAYMEAIKYMDEPYLYGNMGWGYYLLNEFDEAVDYSKRALELNPTLVYVRMNMGISYLRMRDYSRAFQSYQEIAQFLPDPTEYDGGIRDLRELQLQRPGQFPFSHFIIGYLLMQQGHYQESRDSLTVFLSSRFPLNAWKNKALEMLEKMVAD